MTRRASRTDANHSEIRSALRSIGCYVIDASNVGAGFPDLVAGWRGKWMLIEVKDGSKPPSKRKLTADQMVLHAEAERVGCEVHVVHSVDEAISAVQSETLKR